MDEYLAVVKLFALQQGYTMRGWHPCDGHEMNINQNTALYSLLGNRFGGDGHTTFKLPKITCLDPNMVYHICTEGLYPSRD